ncbi:MAG: beta-N-acetylhexosaminidase, partial [Lentisphaerae bacterium]|nr:beta-N-acetylhexosaminidase [Lentisphaerota bacterium]
MQFNWRSNNTPQDIDKALKTLENFLPFARNTNNGRQLLFKKTRQPRVCKVEYTGQTITITYSNTAQVGRALGALLSGLVLPEKQYAEETPFETLGIMLDCSRNAVMTVEHLKLWLNRLFLLGYNMVMLYTEDTYAIPGEPWFGYQRGAYTKQEIKAIDDYASILGIEIIPCIQTLGHLEKILRHQAYKQIKDTQSVMMVGEPATYALIEKMIKFWKSACRTKRIHIGMDETWDLGLGHYLYKNGYKDGFHLFNEHLARVIKICRKHGLKPMIWSDMYFRLGSKTMNYYDPETTIPRNVVKQIPKETDLVYWDYYHTNKEFYLDWISRHRKLGKEPLVASGIRTSNKYWYDHRLTAKRASACLKACREAKVKELFFTQWGDNGAYCDHD